MARVSTIINAGLASAALPQVEKPELEALPDPARERARRTIERETAGLPRDILQTGAAAAGLGFVFGPLGALLGGAVTAHYQKKRREGIAAYAQQSAESAEDILKQGAEALDKAYSLAETDEEKAEVELLREQYEGMAAASRHPDPQISVAALTKAQELSGTLAKNYDDWEQERIAAKAELDAQSDRMFNRYQSLDADLTGKSQRFLGAQETWNKAQLAYERPNPQSDMALVYLTAQMIDPGAIVTDGDSKMIKATGSLTQQMAGYLNSLIDGTSGFDEDVRDGLMSTIAENYLPMRRDQMQRNSEYQELGQQAGLEGAYLKNLQVRIDSGEAEAINGFRSFNPRNAGIPVESGEPFQAVEPSTTSSVLSDALQGAENLAGDISRTLRGEQLVATPDGRNAIKRADGTIEEVAPESVMQDQDGNTYQRVDHGSGRVEWVPLKRNEPGPRARPGAGRQGRNNPARYNQ